MVKCLICLNIFNQEFNLSFFKPKKDVWICCEVYKNVTKSDINKLKVIEILYTKKKRNFVKKKMKMT